MLTHHICTRSNQWPTSYLEALGSYTGLVRPDSLNLYISLRTNSATRTDCWHLHSLAHSNMLRLHLYLSRGKMARIDNIVLGTSSPTNVCMRTGRRSAIVSTIQAGAATPSSWARNGLSPKTNTTNGCSLEDGAVGALRFVNQVANNDVG